MPPLRSATAFTGMLTLPPVCPYVLDLLEARDAFEEVVHGDAQRPRPEVLRQVLHDGHDADLRAEGPVVGTPFSDDRGAEQSHRNPRSVSRSSARFETGEGDSLEGYCRVDCTATPPGVI